MVGYVYIILCFSLDCTKLVREYSSAHDALVCGFVIKVSKIDEREWASFKNSACTTNSSASRFQVSPDIATFGAHGFFRPSVYIKVHASSFVMKATNSAAESGEGEL